MAATGGVNTEDIRKRDPNMALAVEKMHAREQAKTQDPEELNYFGIYLYYLK